MRQRPTANRYAAKDPITKSKALTVGPNSFITAALRAVREVKERANNRNDEE